ncbi:hypothetical protein [Schlesneria sp. DSM 10557]|uniref:hypothetical protein n=1 Tax=Schlesneria sp. DSM 10557 TaxID=3044399 RepID=UPI0035A0A8DF
MDEFAPKHHLPEATSRVVGERAIHIVWTRYRHRGSANFHDRRRIAVDVNSVQSSLNAVRAVIAVRMFGSKGSGSCGGSGLVTSQTREVDAKHYFLWDSAEIAEAKFLSQFFGNRSFFRKMIFPRISLFAYITPRTDGRHPS